MFKTYMNWLHTRWPAGTVEKLPRVEPDGSTSVPGLYVVGDLTGIPLLKFSADTGARAVQSIVADSAFQSARKETKDEVVDLVILGAGVSGMAAALEARKQGLSFELLEAAQPFATIANFPKRKPIFTYPTDMEPTGELKVSAQVKEELLEELRAQTTEAGITPRIARAESVQRKGGLLEVVIPKAESLRARAVIVGIGRSGNFRRLGVAGENLSKVNNRVHDPKDFTGKHVLVVGGGDNAMETSIAIAQNGGHVTLSYRKPEFSRPKPENVARLHALAADPEADVAIEEPSSARVTTATGRFVKDMVTGPSPVGSVSLMLASKVLEITDKDVLLKDSEGEERRIENDAVFPMIGREPPLEFFRRSGVEITGELSRKAWASLAAFVAFMTFVYHWKGYELFPASPGVFEFELFSQKLYLFFTTDPKVWVSQLEYLCGGADAIDQKSLLYTLFASMKGPSFYYTLAYSLAVLIFGLRRIKRRPTPYVRAQTLTLMCIQWLPLFILPELILPWMGRNEMFIEGATLKPLADLFFEPYDGVGVERAYWRSYGFVLAWPLMVYNWFTDAPMWGWLMLGFVQTFVLLPLAIRRWGKGVYCGWICSCGALAETLGDTHRHKMPHGPKWNRLNMVGQGVLALAVLLMVLRIYGWCLPEESRPAFNAMFSGLIGGKSVLSYKWFVDILLGGILGVGLYFWFSGRVWCRFACPLAALMHIYARFSEFRIFADKKKCISCNVCTSVCHQGIDIMNFANKGLPMADPECVRCSACVQSCPTGVLEFGRLDLSTGELKAVDSLAASPVRMAERGGAK